MGRCAVEGEVRIPLAGSVQPGAGPCHRPRVPRRNVARRRRESRALLLDVRTEVLQHGVDPAGARVRAAGDGGEVGRVPEEKRDIRKSRKSEVSSLNFNSADLMLARGVRYFVAATAVIAVFAYIVVFSRLGYT